MSPAQVSGRLTVRNQICDRKRWLAIHGLPGVIRSKMVLRPDDYDALAAFRYAMRKFLRFSKDALAEVKVTPEQYEALLAIKARGDSAGIIIGELSERLQVKHHTAVSLIDKLVSRKLVTRARATKDRRQVQVKLTRLGNSTLVRLAAIHRREMRKRSPEMIQALRRLQK
jgi:DNA-binding MarR family transcriptional regulator